MDKIYELERSTELLRQSEEKLHDFEIQLRMKYPQEAPLVLEKVIYQVSRLFTCMSIQSTVGRCFERAVFKCLVSVFWY